MSPRPESYADALRGRRGAPSAVGVEPPPAGERVPRLLLRPLLRYVPVVLGGGLVWHLYVHGLQPAWSEHRRLSEAHTIIAGDNQSLRALHRDLLLAQEALEDPHYQERRRRWRAERLTARARLPAAEESRPADLADLARLLAAGAGGGVPPAHVMAAHTDTTADAAQGSAATTAVPPAPPVDHAAPPVRTEGAVAAPVAGARTAPAPSGVR